MLWFIDLLSLGYASRHLPPAKASPHKEIQQ